MNKLLIIYTMGKVASTTVSESLLASGVICYDVHTLKKDTILRNLQSFIDKDKIPSNHYGRSIDIWQRFQKRKNVHIITLVRDSLSYNISKVFQNLPKGQYNLTEISQKIYKYPADSAARWLEHELKATTNIDLLDYAFDKEKNYITVKKDRFNLLVMRFDLDDSIKEKVISDFIDQKIKLRTRNDSQRKWYASLYADFKAKGALTKEYVDACHDSPYMKHFYSESEIAALLKKHSSYYKKEVNQG